MLSGWPSIASWAMPAALQKRLVKFLLKRAVGQFLRDELDLDHLDVQLGQGVVQLRELALNVQIFNEITTDLPFNVVDGRIGGITVTIPWKNIWQGDCQLEIHDFLLVVEVKGPENNEQLVGVDMASSHLMASSIHFADDFLRHEIPEAASTMSDNNGNSNSNSNSNDGGDLHGMEKELHQSLMSSVYAMAREGSTLSHITATDSDAASSSIMLDNSGGTPPAVDDTGMEGLQVLAGLIERLISRVKVMIHNTRLRLLVHPPVDSSSSSSSSTNLNNELLNSDVTKTTEALDHWLRSTMGAKGNDYADILSEAILSRIHPEETGHTTTNPTDQSAEPASTNPGDIAEDKGPTVTVIELDVPVITLMEYNADTDSSSETDSSTANLPGHVMKSLLFNGVHIWLRELYGTGLEDVVTSSSSPLPLHLHLRWIKTRIEPTFADNSSIPPLSLQSRADETKDSLIGRVQLSILELNLFLMLDESSISSSTCLDNNEASEEKKDRIDRLYQLLTKESHMKWSMNQISILWQCFHCLNNSRQHRSRRSNTSRQQQHHHRQSINYRSRNTTGPVIPQRSTLDVKVQQIQLLVWLMNQMDTASSTSMPDSTDDSPLMADSRPSVFEQYQCILSFSNDLLANYRDNNGFDENTDEGDNDLTENVLLCHMEQNNGQDCINIKTQPILLTIDLRQLEQLKLYFEMSQFYQQLSSIPLDTYRATPEMENSLDISFDTEYRMKSHKRGQIDTMAQCSAVILQPSHLSTKWYNATEQTTLSWTTPLIRIDVGVPDGLRKELPTMNHLVESLQFDILQSRLHSPSDEAALLGEIALNNPITSNSTTATPSAPSSTNRRNHHKTGATKMTSTSSDDTDRIRWSCDAIHGFINDRSCQYKSTHFLSISSSNDQSPMIDVTLRAKSAFDTYSGISRSNNPSTVDPAEGVQQIFTVYEGDERIRVQMVEDEDQLYFKQRSLEHSLVVVDVQLPKIDVTVTKAVYDSLITMGAHLSVWELDRVLGTSSSTTHNTERDHGKFNQSSSYYKSNHSASAPLDLSNLEQSYLEHASMTSEVSSVYYEARSTTSGLNNDGGENRATSPVIHPMASMLRIGHVTVNLLCDIPMMASSRNTRSDYDIKETESSISSSSQCSEAVGYRIQLTQLDFFTLKQAMGKHVVLASGETFFMAHELSDGTQTTFLFRDQSVTPLSSKPAFSLSIQTTIIPDINQIQNVLFNLTVNDVVLRVTPNMQHLALLADWMASPQGLPQVDNVKRYIQATVSLNDLCLDYKTPTSAARAALTLESIKISTHIQPDMHTLELKTITKDTKLWIVEDAATLLSDQGLEYHVNLYSPAYWKAIGYVQVASLDYLDVTLSLSLSQPVPFVQVEMSNHLLAFDTCADSTQTLEHLMQDLGSHFKSESSQEDTTLEDELDGIQMDEPSTSNTIEELLADLEQDTFTAKKSTTSSSSIHVTRPSQEWQFTSDKGNESEDEQIYSLEDEELLMVEDHFSALSATVIASTMPTSSETPKSHRQSLPGTRFRLHLSDFHVTWRLHGGFDWEVHRREAAVAAALGKERQRQRNEEQKQQQQQQQASTSSTSINDATATYTGDIVQESMSDTSDTISETFTEVTQVPLFDSDAENDGSDARYLLRTYGRSKSAKLEVKFMYITMEAEVYEPDQRDAFRVRLGVRDVEIIDHIRTSVWNKFLTAMRSDGQSAPRESSSSMIRVDLTSVRPDPVKYKHREELRVKIRILPLRFHIDQDALNFAIQFFKIDELLAPSRATLDVNEQTKPTTPVHRSDRPYLVKRFELKPMMMKIDYKPKKFGLSSLREGQFLELMNVFQLDGSEITLRQVKLTGISGIHRLVDAIQATWLPHIGYTQVSNFVSGVAPIRSMVNIGSGMADLVLLPIEQYRKDGRIIRGLQRGLQSFTKSTAMEAIKLGTKLAVGTQVLLEHADDILSFDGPNTLLSASPPNSNSSTSSSITAMPGAAAMARQSSLGHSQWREDPLEGPSSIGGGGSSNTNTNTRSGHYSSSSTTTTRHGNTTSLRDNPTLTSTSKYGEQPTSFNEGIELAYDSMRRNVGTAAHTIFAVPMEVYERTGTQGSVKAVIRAVPVAVLRPMIGASEAFSKALMGLRNTIDPTQKLQMEDKYKSGRQ
ncbi:hypothetical protein BDF22DRAFT_667643 [Syncephalis plumigaleata]|nr:hypothetical protein BDF22DRAFT_667643 [Syncephalis plumigaleata]